MYVQKRHQFKPTKRGKTSYFVMKNKFIFSHTHTHMTRQTTPHKMSIKAT